MTYLIVAGGCLAMLSIFALLDRSGRNKIGTARYGSQQANNRARKRALNQIHPHDT